VGNPSAESNRRGSGLLTDIHQRKHQKREKDHLHKLNQRPVRLTRQSGQLQSIPIMQGIRDDSITMHKPMLIVSLYFQILALD
jgi:hypothetical protein